MFNFRKAVLIIHGFAGGTYDEEPLLFYLQPIYRFDVFNFTLPGHMTNLSTDVEYEDWIHAVDKRINKLVELGYNDIYLVGHSMGGVLATYAAIKHKQVKKLVLIAPAFQYLSTDKDESTFSKSIKYGPELVKTYNPKEILSRFLKVSIQQLKEFEKIVSDAQENPVNIKVPTFIIQGLSDQVVPYESSEKIYNEMTCKKYLLEIEGVTHDVFYGEKVEEICEEISKFLKKTNYDAENIRKW